MTPENVTRRPLKGFFYSLVSMIGKVYYRDALERSRILEELAAELKADSEVAFACVYGSFVEGDAFHDIDLGVYLRSSRDTGDSIDLGLRLSRRVKLLVDVRILNFAPVPFLYHALRGRLLLSKDDDIRSEVIESTVRRYLDIAPLLRRSAKEAFAA